MPWLSGMSPSGSVDAGAWHGTALPPAGSPLPCTPSPFAHRCSPNPCPSPTKRPPRLPSSRSSQELPALYLTVSPMPRTPPTTPCSFEPKKAPAPLSHPVALLPVKLLKGEPPKGAPASPIAPDALGTLGCPPRPVELHDAQGLLPLPPDNPTFSSCLHPVRQEFPEVFLQCLLFGMTLEATLWHSVRQKLGPNTSHLTLGQSQGPNTSLVKLSSSRTKESQSRIPCDSLWQGMVIAMNSSSKWLLPAHTGTFPCSQAPRWLCWCCGQGHLCMTQRKDNRNQDLALLLGILWSANGCQVNEDDKHAHNKLMH